MMNDKYSISVVIPCYNSSKTIKECVGSIVSQTFPVKEIIVVDDGSSDNTFEILLELKELLSNLALSFITIQQQNFGPSVARNRGIAMATGNWIAFLDSDDLWENQKVERQIEVLKNDEKIVLCATGYGNEIVKDENIVREVIFKKHLFRTYFNTPTVLIKSDIVKSLLFDESLKYSEDFRLWLQVNYKYKCVKLNRVLARNIDNKRVFGEVGLSSALWKMEKGELSNFLFLHKKGYITTVLCLRVCAFSLLKFLRRLIQS